MSEEPRHNLKQKFLAGEKIRESNLHDIIDSLVHKSEDSDLIKQTVGLDANEVALSSNAQAADVDPTGTEIAGALAEKANSDASNISAEIWRQELSVPSISSFDNLGNFLMSHTNDENNPHSVTAAQVGLEDVSQAEAETGTATTRRAWTAQRVRQAINAVSVLLTGNQAVDGIKTFLQHLVSNELRARTDDGLDISKSNGASLIRVGKDGASKTGVAEGSSIASGQYSHAEGFGTIASGPLSHAEGFNTTASGHHSHAEGRETTASGSRSHAEGLETTASGAVSHAEGWDTTASGFSSHAGGISSLASQLLSYARGRRASSVHTGASVESDNEDADFESTADNQKSCRYAGGYRFMGGEAEFEGGIDGLVIGTDIQAQNATLQALADAADDAERRAAVGGAAREPQTRVATLAGTDTLTATSAEYQFLNPDGADRTVELPETGLFAIQNTAAPGTAFDLNVVESDGTTAVDSVGPGVTLVFKSTGPDAWRVL